MISYSEFLREFHEQTSNSSDKLNSTVLSSPQKKKLFERFLETFSCQKEKKKEKVQLLQECPDFSRYLKVAQTADSTGVTSGVSFNTVEDSKFVVLCYL